MAQWPPARQCLVVACPAMLASVLRRIPEYSDYVSCESVGMHYWLCGQGFRNVRNSRSGPTVYVRLSVGSRELSAELYTTVL